LAGHGNCYSDRTRRGFAWTVCVDELACLATGNYNHWRHHPLLPGTTHCNPNADGCGAPSADGTASQAPPSPAIAVFPIAVPAIVTAPGIAAIATIVVLNRHDLVHQTIVVTLLLGVMALNLLALWNTETILKHGLAGVLPVVGWVLAVLQASLAVQMVIYSLRVLEALHWPAS